MFPQFQFRRFFFFLSCVSLTIFTIFCYSYSNEFTANLVQPYLNKQLQSIDLEKLQFDAEMIKNPKEVETQQNLLQNLTKNSDIVSFFKSMVVENLDFFIKLKDMQMRNVSFSEAGEDQLSEIDSAPKPEDQLPSTPNLFDLLSKMKPIESNLLPDDIESSSISPKTSLNEDPKQIQHQPSLPYLGKVSKIYPTGFLYSPSNICENKSNDLKLIIIVTSAPGNFEARKAIRNTWGYLNSTESVKLVFIVGSSIPKNENKLKEENAEHADIIHGNFIDSYYNLTLKTISMLEWVKDNCKNVKFILKADDDTFINVNKLLEIIKPRNNETKSIYGRVGSSWTPFRNPKSKYYISYDEFADSVFPDFTSGPAYLMTSDCADLIYNEALDQKYLKLEDVFITGIIASRLSIQRIHLKEFLNEKPSLMDICLIRESISVHYISPREQYKLWKNFDDEHFEC